ncbi:hypothetical protein L6452_39130 [Arctium lappa]|nr:hypothetical protein L6452_39130 [Arctium lappa]
MLAAKMTRGGVGGGDQCMVLSNYEFPLPVNCFLLHKYRSTITAIINPIQLSSLNRCTLKRSVVEIVNRSIAKNPNDLR